MLSGSEEDDVPSVKPQRRKRIVNKETFDILQVKCEWNGCNQVLLKSKSTFYNHVSAHLQHHDIVVIDEFGEEEKYKCNWSSCSFQVQDPKEITRHLKYHAYHAELRALGEHVSKVLKLPPCMILNEFNVLTNVDDLPLVCSWNFCGEVSRGIMEFIEHVHFHVKLLPNHMNFKCLWTDCNSDFQLKSKLSDHVKTHTKQHFIACSQCGHTFANTTKFVDHCLTQKPFEEHTYQCDYCLSFHPSERILRKHMGQHIHHYKCPFCNMTCNKPSLLAKHIRYRHLNYRAFKCSLCHAKCKSKQDLQLHVLTHVKGLHVCQEEDCSYFTPSQLAMKLHSETLHVPGKERGLFCCHICDKKYKAGAKLTKHLAAKHNLKRPPGYSRFIYRLESDGYRRLQSVRLESVEVQEVVEQEQGPHTEAGRMEEAGNAIAVDVLSETGDVVSSSLIIPEDSLPPQDAEILAIGE